MSPLYMCLLFHVWTLIYSFIYLFSHFNFRTEPPGLWVAWCSLLSLYKNLPSAQSLKSRDKYWTFTRNAQNNKGVSNNYLCISFLYMIYHQKVARLMFLNMYTISEDIKVSSLNLNKLMLIWKILWSQSRYVFD